MPSYLSLNVLEFAKTFGLGIAVLLFWLYFLLKEIADYKLKERKYVEDLLYITRDNIETMSSITNIIQAIAPAISNSSVETRKQVDVAIVSLKDHITNQTEILKIAVSRSNRND